MNGWVQIFLIFHQSENFSNADIFRSEIRMGADGSRIRTA